MSKIVEEFEVGAVQVGEVYGGKVTIPDGWEYVAFRVPKPKEHWVTIIGQSVAGPVHQDIIGFHRPNGPRVIVRRAR